MYPCIHPNMLSLLINSRSLSKYPTEKTKLHTRNSTNLSIRDDATFNKNRERKRLQIFRSNQLQLKGQGEEFRWSLMDKDGIKTVISDDNHQDLKKDQRFQGLKKQLQTYTSEEKLLGRRFNRRCKIFDAKYLQKSEEGRNCHFDNTGMSSTRRLIQKIENILPVTQKETQKMPFSKPQILRNQIDNEIILQPVIPEVKNTQRMMTTTGIHATAASKINIRPHFYASPKKITFTYLNCNVKQHQIPPVACHQHEPQSIYSKIIGNDSYNFQNRSTQLKTSKVLTKLTYDHINPVTTKIKKAKIPRKMTFEEYINRQEAGKSEIWGKHSKISRIYVGKHNNQAEKSRARQQVCSKISINNLCRQSLIMNNNDKMGKIHSKKDSFSNVEEDNSSHRYFDDTDEGFMAKNISYKNIEIEKEDKCSEIEEMINPQNLFIDFQSSQVEEKSKETDKQAKMSNIHLDRTKSADHLSKISQYATQGKKTIYKADNLISIALISMATLLLMIQMFS